MHHATSLNRAVVAALGIAATLALAGCGNAPNPQAAATNANMTMATSAASAQLPPAAGGPVQAGAAPTAAAPQAPAAAPPPPAGPEFAQVVAVRPILVTHTTSNPHQVCRNEEVAVPETYKDRHQVGGAVVGGLAGALAGRMIGHGKGKTLATVAGAAGGAFAGHEIQKHHQENNATREEMRNVCHTVTDKSTSTKTAGYDVTYTYQGRSGHVRMTHNPGVGTGLPVQDGVVVAQGTPRNGGY